MEVTYYKCNIQLIKAACERILVRRSGSPSKVPRDLKRCILTCLTAGSERLEADDMDRGDREWRTSPPREARVRSKLAMDSRMQLGNGGRPINSVAISLTHLMEDFLTLIVRRMRKARTRPVRSYHPP